MAPLLLIKDGQLQRRNLRQELLTEDELMGQLRAEDIGEVKRSFIEGDGRVSVIKKE
jgi:uncharacterized membrane protein YcaP (DUF421 family)